MRRWERIRRYHRGLIAMAFLVVGCGRQPPSESSRRAPTAPESSPGRVASLAEDSTVPIVQWASVPELNKDVAIMASVFWEPEDTVSLRRKISAESILKNSHVLEVGTGSGLISLCCLQAGAASVVATDLNPNAVRNALFNAREMGFAERLDVRLVPRRSPGAWTIIPPEMTFDLIISNPPWEDRKPTSVEEFALYDPNFLLLKSLVTGARQRLKPNGRMWLAYGCVTAIRKIQELAALEDLNCTILDERKLESLPETFLPGMLIEISVRSQATP